MTISEIYAKYQILPNLQLHQLRVAGVGEMVSDNWMGELPYSRRDLVTALLLHDMGNIIKFDLDNFTHFMGPEAENLSHWKQVKAEYIEKYGPNEYRATLAIVDEIGVNPTVVSIIKNMGKHNLQSDHTDWSAKIATYADMRVGPLGILNVNDRFGDIIARYSKRPKYNSQYVETGRQYSLAIEKSLQSHIIRQLNTFNNFEIDKYIPALKNIIIKKTNVYN